MLVIQSPFHKNLHQSHSPVTEKQLQWFTAVFTPQTVLTPVEVAIEDSYRNMKEKILPHPEILDRARRAYRRCGVEPVDVAIRGGTDGAKLSFLGLPCPNLSTGGYHFHGVHEYIPRKALEKMTEVLISLLREGAGKEDEKI